MTDWGGMRTIIDNRKPPEDRVDCPVCGTVLVSNGERWTCPFGGDPHWNSTSLPRE